MENKKYNVFISYSRKDYVDEQQNIIPGNVVSTIKERLTAEGITYWFDEEGIYSGQNFIDKIVTNIEMSQIFVFLSTANSNNSHWTCKEIASADEFGKHIIPVRVDKTPYNKKVMFRIADLSYIEYYTNPEKGLNDLVASIKSHIEQIEAENRRKREEVQKREEEKKRLEEAAKKKKFEEEMRLQKEQEKVITDIKLKCTKLNNEETKLELDRENLLLSAERVVDEKEKKSLTDFIIDSSPIRIKCSKEKEGLLAKIEKIEKEKDSLVAISDKKLKEREYDKNETEKLIEKLSTENCTLQRELKNAQDKLDDCRTTIYNLNKEITNIRKTNIKNSNQVTPTVIRIENTETKKVPQLKYLLYIPLISLIAFIIGIYIYCYNNYPEGVNLLLSRMKSMTMSDHYLYTLRDQMINDVNNSIIVYVISLLMYYGIYFIIKKESK